MQRGEKFNEEQKQKTAEGIRRSWNSGDRKHPMTQLKEDRLSALSRLAAVEKRLEDSEARLTSLESWKTGIQTVMKQHDTIVQAALKRPDNPIGQFVADLLAEMQK